MKNWRGGGCSVVAALFLAAACGSGERQEGKATTPPGGNEHNRQRGVVLTVESEEAGICGRDRDFRFGIVNDTGARLTDASVLFLRNPLGDIQGRASLICGATADGRCVLRSISMDLHPQPVPPECLLRLAPGDDFACRAALPETHVGPLLVGLSGGAPVRVEAAANCQPEPATGDISGVLTVTDDESGECGVDRNFRFALNNTTGHRLDGMLVHFESTLRSDNVPMRSLLCGADDEGTCIFQRFAADVRTNFLAGIFPDCVLKLSAGDDFACHATLPQTGVRAFLDIDGTDVRGESQVSCQAAPADDP